jgi:hypothetical protein
MILGIFSDRERAENLITQLETRGYNPKDISILMKIRDEAREMSESTGVGDVAEGALAGATTGAVVGGLAGLLASTILPGLGGFFIGGPIGAALGLTGAAATTVSGAATGAAAGGILGALTSTFGLSDEEARTYEQRVQEGGILVAVPTRLGEESEVRDLMTEFGADNIKEVDQTTTRENVSRRSESMDSSESFQPAYFNQVTPKEEKSSGNENKGWEGESKRHSEAAKKGKSQTKAHFSTVSRTKKTEVKEGRGWHGDSKGHAKARRGEESK